MAYKLTLYLKRTPAGNLTIECSDPPGKAPGVPCKANSNTAYVITIEGEGTLTTVDRKTIQPMAAAAPKATADTLAKAAKKAASDPPGKRTKKAVKAASASSGKRAK